MVAQKKSLIAQERDPWQRAAFQVEQTEQNADLIVVVDESGANLNLTRRYAWAPRGQRAIGSVPRNTPPNTTVIASLSTAGIGPSMIFSGGTDHLAFCSYIEKVLAPSLRTGQLVVMDNLSAHKHPRVRELIEARGCQLWYLPPYSPDFSPIELAFAKVKQELRKAAARTSESLEVAIATALSHISSADARAFFKHCGYRVLPNWDQLIYSAL